MHFEAQVHVFISFHHGERSEVGDAAHARQLFDALDSDPQRRFRPFAYHADPVLGWDIGQSIANEIRGCDVFCLVATQNAADSEWVQREVGLALRRRQLTNGPFPLIVPVFVDREHPGSFTPRDYDRGESLPPILINDLAGFSLQGLSDPTQCARIFESLSIRFDPLDQARSRMQDIERQMIELYNASFTEDERIDPEVFLGMLKDDSWKHLAFVQTIGSQLQGFISVSGPGDGDWLFGNYLVVHRAARGGGRADLMIESLKGRLLQLNPDYRGVVFEIEPVDLPFLAQIARQAPHWESDKGRFSEAEQNEVQHQVARLQRLSIYSSVKCRILCDRHGTPVPYRQPDMTGALDASHECALWLGIRVINDRGFQDRAEDDLDQKVLDFVYRGLFLEHSYASRITDEDRWPPYVNALATEIANAYERPGRFDKVKVPHEVRLWYSRNKHSFRRL